MPRYVEKEARGRMRSALEDLEERGMMTILQGTEASDRTLCLSTV